MLKKERKLSVVRIRNLVCQQKKSAKMCFTESLKVLLFYGFFWFLFLVNFFLNFEQCNAVPVDF